MESGNSRDKIHTISSLRHTAFLLNTPIFTPMEFRQTIAQVIDQATGYLILAGQNSLNQLILFFGPTLVLAFIINYLSLLNNRLINQIFGTQGYLVLFGWLGVPVHETGHALFALLFGHKIKEVKLFKPDPKTGTLGYVLHEYNPRSLFHQVGNFFIGIGPILLGTLILIALSWFFFRINIVELPSFRFSVSKLGSAEMIQSGFSVISEGFRTYFKLIINNENSSWWKIALFAYALLAIGSAIKLSWPDIAGAAKGFLFIVLLFLIFNLATSWIGTFSNQWPQKVEPYLSGFLIVLLLTVLINLAFVPVLVLVLLIKKAIIPGKKIPGKRQ
jgi:hypothetical protein